MCNLPLQISSIPSFKPQVSKIERTERTCFFSDSGSCAAGCPIAGRDLTRKAARSRLNVVAMLDQCSSGHISDYYTPESRVCKDVSRPESTRGLFWGLSRHLRRSLRKKNALNEVRLTIRPNRPDQPVHQLCR